MRIINVIIILDEIFLPVSKQKKITRCSAKGFSNKEHGSLPEAR